jgi:hypothetical protein
MMNLKHNILTFLEGKAKKKLLFAFWSINKWVVALN